MYLLPFCHSYSIYSINNRMHAPQTFYCHELACITNNSIPLIRLINHFFSFSIIGVPIQNNITLSQILLHPALPLPPFLPVSEASCHGSHLDDSLFHISRAHNNTERDTEQVGIGEHDTGTHGSVIINNLDPISCNFSYRSSANFLTSSLSALTAQR